MKHELGIRYLGNREQARKQITRRIVNTCRRILLALREEPLPEQFRLPLLPNGKKPGCDVIGGENSSRTILSTGQAAENIGCRVRCINPATLSLTKGESWWETVQTFAEQGTQIIAIRSGHEGLMVHLAMMQETVKPGRLTDPSLCFINCGEGTREHPTQYEQDVATIFLRHLGARWLDQNDREILERAFSRPSAQEQLEQEAAEALDNATFAFVGGLRESRVAHSHINGGRWFDTKFIFIAPSQPIDFQVEPWCLDLLGERADVSHRLEDALEADYVYAIRLQVERLPKSIQEQQAEVRALVRPYMIGREFLEKCRGEVLDAKPYDEGTPTIQPEAREHLKVIAKLQSGVGLYNREEAIFECFNNRHEPLEPIFEIPEISFAPGVDIISTMKLSDKRRELTERYSEREDEPLSIVVIDGVVINAIQVGRSDWLETINEKSGWGREMPMVIGKRFPSESLGKKNQLGYPKARIEAQQAGIWRLADSGIRLHLMYPELEKNGGNGHMKVIPPYPKAVAGVFKCPRGDKCFSNAVNNPLVQSFSWIIPSKSEVWMECGYCQFHYPAEVVATYTFGH